MARNFKVYPVKVQYQSGFSLVELSIVLVILGLLVGGVLGGRSLIKAAELRAVTQEFNAMQVAKNTFLDKYRGIPGDFNQAHLFWGLMPGATVARLSQCSKYDCGHL